MADVAKDTRTRQRRITITALVLGAVALFFYVVTFLKA
jgi:hypothetical protein